ncbi:MAG: aminopeptidase [Thermoplasmata archaeon]|jgi:leucyl aminopeptidase (aminopeptidase T)
MGDPSPQEADRLARQVLTVRLHLKPGENVTIETYPSALPWALGFVREVRRLGARPLLHYEDERSYWTAVEEGRYDSIGQPGSHEWAALAKTDVYIYFWGPEDGARLEELPSATFEKLVAFNSKWYELASRSGVRGARMGIARVTPANARHWGVSFDAWRKEVVAASKLDPKQLVADSRKVQKALEGGHTARMRHPNGTDLNLALAGRKARVDLGWVTAASQRARFGMMTSVPDGCVYVAIDESTADGTFVSNRMSSQFGEPVRGGKWTFRRGRLVGQSYGEGAASVREAYARGGKGRDRPALLEVGLNPAVHMAPGLDESERGAVTAFVGSNIGYGGRTRSNFFGHLTVAGAELSIDGRTIVRDGRIL